MTTTTPIQRACARCKTFIHPRFFWASDFKSHGKTDQWDDLYEKLQQPGVVEGDCDDYALTCMTWLERDGGVPEAVEGARALLCYTEDGEVHMVCGVDDREANVTWVLDCRYPRVLPSGSMVGYRWVASCRRGTWTKL